MNFVWDGWSCIDGGAADMVQDEDVPQQRKADDRSGINCRDRKWKTRMMTTTTTTMMMRGGGQGGGGGRMEEEEEEEEEVVWTCVLLDGLASEGPTQPNNSFNFFQICRGLIHVHTLSIKRKSV
jgi:hypothetical protein